jgi:hypothetical protein
MKVSSVSSTAVRAMKAIGALSYVGTAAFACGGAEETPHGAVVRDSAGIVIVESYSPQWRDGGGWSLSREPLVQIGSVEGAPEYQFSRIEGPSASATAGSSSAMPAPTRSASSMGPAAF